MPVIAYLPKPYQLDTGSNLRAGAKAYWYVTGTSTPKNTYSDFAMTTPNTNPVIADANGIFPVMFLATDQRYRITLRDSADVLIYTQDDIAGPVVTQADVGAALYPQTAAELAAGVTPTNYQYPPLSLQRYGTNTTPGTTDMTTAFNNAIIVANIDGGEVVFDQDVKVLNVTMKDGVSIRGVGNPQMTITAGAASDVALSLVGTVGTTAALNANASQGALSVSVASAAGFAIGDWVVVREQTFVTGSDGQKMQIEKIFNISGGTITLSGELLDAYTTGASAEIAKLSPISGFKLSGFTIKNSSASNGGCINMQYCADFTIDGLTLIGASGFASLKTYYCAHGLITGCTVRDTQGGSIGSSIGLGLYINDSHHIAIDNNEFYNYTENAFDLRSRMCSFTNNRCHHAIDTGVNTHGETNSDILIANNLIDGSDSFGIAVGFSSNVSADTRITVRGNKVRNCAGHGISVVSSAGKEHTEITVAGNDVSAFKVSSGSTSNGINVNYVTDFICEGNRVNGATVGNAPDAAITISNATRVKCDNNYVENLSAGYGIQLATVVDYSVTGNFIYNISSNNVYCTSSSGNSVVRNNRADDSTHSVDDANVVSGGNTWDTGTFTATATGLTTSPTDTVDYVRNNRVVTLNFRGGVSGTSNSIALTFTGLPTILFPARNQRINAVSVTDNSAALLGRLTITTAGVATWGTSFNSDTFTNSGTKGWNLVTMSYALD